MMDADLRACLDRHVDPRIGRGLAEAGIVQRAQRVGAQAQVELQLAIAAAGWGDELAAAVRAHVQAELGLSAQVNVAWRVTAQGAPKNLPAVPGVKNLIAVASGKGGVGKSTVAANLALALAADGARVGMLDADIYGPSQPRMLGVDGQRPTSPDGKRMHPILAHGIQVSSIGFLIDDDQPMIWRGPMATQALAQLLGETAWDDVDYLIVDLPPGTGDIQLSLSQRVPLSGAVIVTTPQDIALLDARKGLQMFRKVDVPVLGIVENMAWHVCANCGHREAIFGEGGGDRLARDYAVELLGQLPLQLAIREQADRGTPTVIADPSGETAQRYLDIARKAAAHLAYGMPTADFPTIEMTDD